jgi:hypothetical protein
MEYRWGKAIWPFGFGWRFDAAGAGGSGRLVAEVKGGKDRG